MKIQASKTYLSLAVVAAISGYNSTALAAESQAQPQTQMEEITVKGFRQSLLKNRDVKRDSLIAQDSIVAEDIADFPDLNLAESLQRVPGVTITREGGEGRQISLRGLGPDFTRVELNGLDVLATSGSSMDSRGQANRSRGFDFNVFASELFSQIDVKKAFSASMEEGGIGGTVALRPAKPFDYQGFNAAVSAQAGVNSMADGTSPRLAALVSNTWDNFGALFSVAYSKRDTVEEGYNTYRWRPLDASGSDISGLDQAVQDQINNKEIRFARGNRYSIWQNEQERLGVTAAFQFNVSDKLSFDLDVLYAELNNNKNEHHIATRGAGLSALGGSTTAGGQTVGGAVVNDIKISNTGEAIYTDISNATLATESRIQVMDTTFNQISLLADWQISDSTVAKFLIGHSENEFVIPVSDKVFYEGFGGIISDYSKDRFYAQNTYDFDIASIDNWKMHEFDLDEDEQNSSIDTIKLSFNTFIGDSGELKYGLLNKSFSSDGKSYRIADALKAEFESGEIDNTLDPAYFEVFTDHDKANWAAANVVKAQDYYGVNANLTEANLLTNSIYDLEETTRSAWAEYQWQNELFGGNFGVRYIQTDVKSIGYISQNDENIKTQAEQDYSYILPALNLVWYAAEDLQFRASISKNLTRPALASLAISGSVNTDKMELSSGNPGLSPYESINYETAMEWYLTDSGFLTAGVFYKDIDNFVISKSVEMQYKNTGFSESLLAPGQTGNTVFTYHTSVNGEKTSIQGVELGGQLDFTFLPAPFNNMGVIANYTFADGEMDYYDGDVYFATKAFPGLSEHSANATLYYETEKWGARISTAYRSEYITHVASPTDIDQDEAGFHGSTYIDFSAFYQLNEQVKLTIEAVNLGNEREEQYSDSDDRAYNTTEFGSTYYLGVNYKF
ncbi:TonB-dependent receptor [Catenovulum sp. 2E275]|uniref:TonB-dependent receptor n=1 Tax=Catenovulum sp. 2E275 TaxID=2980497 RepID=UPI0021D23204|nr:TonB-dependent receptor [Catenovulum sp. 2E275]MCU4676678.1 TonB-dependent receptor [Catenovulum sp. 2E275]